MANVFDGINEIYSKSVKENDKKGFAKIYKESTLKFFEEINKFITEYTKDTVVTFEDIQYLDGYFIFGRGTNSVINFHIKECPGWLFGIWWDEPEKADTDSPKITGVFFAQYEENIDKFKPSHSTIRSEFYSESADMYKVADNILFIKNEPFLAFCRDYCMWDYNLEYHTREDAKAEYDKYIDERERTKKYSAICDEKVLSFVRTKILPLIEDSEIEDRGDSWSPRYEVVAPYEKCADCCERCGNYSLFDIAVIDVSEDEDELSLKSKQSMSN